MKGQKLLVGGGGGWEMVGFNNRKQFPMIKFA